jgi:hypothetical protein
MRWLTHAVLGVACTATLGGSAFAQAGVPSTDIYLAPLSLEHGRPVVGAPVNITHRDGYDNQPSFTPDGRALLYTSIRGDGQADTYRYDLATRATSRVTNTTESEYSPTVMPGGKRFSVIRVEADSTQRLWSFAMDGSDPRVVLADIKPVGYHLWLDDHRLALFVLGDPNALVLADTRTGRADTLARDIGRSLARVPGEAAFTYVQHDSTGWDLRRVDLADAVSPIIRHIAALPPRADYVVWLTPYIVVTASGARLLVLGADRTWRTVSDMRPLHAASRLAVSADGKWLAVVAEP